MKTKMLKQMLSVFWIAIWATGCGQKDPFQTDFKARSSRLHAGMNFEKVKTLFSLDMCFDTNFFSPPSQGNGLTNFNRDDVKMVFSTNLNATMLFFKPHPRRWIYSVRQSPAGFSLIQMG